MLALRLLALFSCLAFLGAAPTPSPTVAQKVRALLTLRAIVTSSQPV